MNAAIINTNNRPYAAQVTVYSNRPGLERYSDIKRNVTEAIQRKGFIHLHGNDRNIYERLVDIVESIPGTYTTGQVRNTIDGMLNSMMHVSLRVRLEKLINNISRDSINELLNGYEAMLCKIAPAIMPNESKEAYATRTNLPEYVVDQTFERGDTEAF